jgi:hypothetical protein
MAYILHKICISSTPQKNWVNVYTLITW